MELSVWDKTKKFFYSTNTKMLITTTRKKKIFSSLFNSEISVDVHRQVVEKNTASVKQDNSSRLRLLSELDAVKEFERHRLARELHDQMGQDLVALMLGIRSLKKELCVTPEITNKLDQLQLIVGQINQQVHDIAWDLRPLILNDLGLRAALLALFEKWSLSTGVKVDFRCSQLGDKELSKKIETGVYRIVQETLSNVAKHAQAKSVLVSVTRFKGRLVVSVTDDGLGFDVSIVKSAARSNRYFGLLGMQERVELLSGTLEIISAPNNGTLVRVTAPLYFRKKR